MRDRYADRITRIERLLIAVYDSLPLMAKTAAALKTTGTKDWNQHTVEDLIKQMREDAERHEDTGQI